MVLFAKKNLEGKRRSRATVILAGLSYFSWISVEQNYPGNKQIFILTEKVPVKDFDGRILTLVNLTLVLSYECEHLKQRTLKLTTN
jgi:hypothetical protein